MRARVFQFRLAGWLTALWLVGVAVAQAQTGLGITSPFLPAGNPAPAVATVKGPIELHGVMVTPAGTRFSIYNTTSKTATWVGLNESGNPFVVRSYRIVGGSDQVTVDYQGGPVILALKEAKIAAATVAQPVMTLSGGVASSVVAPPVQGNPPNLPAGASLEEWAAEIQRRRDLRQQPATPAGVPTPPASPPPAQGASQPAGSRG